MVTRGKKVMGVVLSALLLFWSVAPVPVGVNAIDRLRYEQANANPTVLAPLAIFATALAAYGVYVAGTSTQTYNSNLGTLYSDFATANNMTTAQLDEMLLGAATGTGKIDMALLGSSFFPLVGSWAAGLVSGGSAVSGTSSLGGSVECLYFGTNAFPATNNFPADKSQADAKVAVSNYPDAPLIGMKVIQGSNNSYSNVYYYAVGTPTFYVNNGGTANVYLTLGGSYPLRVLVTHTVDGQTTVSNTKQESPGQISVANAWVLNKSYPFNVSGYTVSAGWSEAVSAVVSDGVLNGTVVAPTATVEPFEPTAAQLEAGYSSADIVEAINSQTGEISDQTGILQGIQTGITAQTGVLQGIQTGITEQTGILGQILSGIGSILSVWEGVQAGPFSWLQTWWNTLSGWLSDVLAWLGDTPLAQLIAQILSAIAAGAADIVASLSGVLAGVIEAIQAAVGDIAIAIDAVLDALMGPVLSQIPINWTGSPFFIPNGNPTPVDLSALSIESELRDKAPFAYMFAFSDGVQQSTANNRASFRIQQDIDLFGFTLPVDINAEPFLLHPVAGTNIAYLLRCCVTLTLCMGLLAMSWRYAMKIINND